MKIIGLFTFSAILQSDGEVSLYELKQSQLRMEVWKVINTQPSPGLCVWPGDRPNHAQVRS